MINKEEWEQWKLDPVTKAFFSFLGSEVDRFKSSWAGGEFVDELTNAQAQSKVSAIDDIKGLSFEEVMEVEL